MVKVDENGWLLAFQGNYQSIFFDPLYINCVCTAFNYKVNYFIARKKHKLVFASALFEDNGKIVVPDGFNYTSIFKDKDLSTSEYFEYIESLIKQLKISYPKISFRLPPSFNDVRPFLWEGFDVVNSYTYIRRSSELISKKVLAKENRLPGTYTFSTDIADEQMIDLCVSKNPKSGIGKGSQRKYISYFKLLSDLKILRSFTISNDYKILATRIVLEDRCSMFMHTLLTNDCGNKDLVTPLNIKTYKWALLNNFHSIDMVGANDMGIGNFKASFNAELTPYFLLNYDKRYAFIISIKNRLTTYFKRMLRKI